MARAAAKNHAWVADRHDPAQYDAVLDGAARRRARSSDDTRRALALEAFARTAAYDAAIVAWLASGDEVLPAHLVLPLDRTDETAALRREPAPAGARATGIAGTTSWWDGVVQHSGLALSYLNLYDADAAWRSCTTSATRPPCAIIKHANPCGVAVADDLADRVPARARVRRALRVRRDRRAEPSDRRGHRVERMVAGPQADVVIAPGYERGHDRGARARSARTRGCSRRPARARRTSTFRQISGGFLVQDAAPLRRRAATTGGSSPSARPPKSEWRDAELAWRICGHVKSNAIVLVKDGQAVGIGAGQQNRVESGEIAAKKAAGRAAGGACASDAFYPFPDGVEAAAAAGVAVVVQPGGSVRRREGDREGRRARPRDGLHGREALPALMMARRDR